MAVKWYLGIVHSETEKQDKEIVRLRIYNKKNQSVWQVKMEMGEWRTRLIILEIENIEKEEIVDLRWRNYWL